MTRNHIMFDIETMGNLPTSAIVSIGAVQFDPYDSDFKGKRFRTVVDLQDCLDHGLTVNGSTILWWMYQSEEAKAAISQKEAHTLDQALYDLTLWVKSICIEFDIPQDSIEVWGRGPGFDLAILRNAYYVSQKGMGETPWKFWNERCVRTIEWLNPAIKKEADSDRTNIAHIDTDDADHQIEYVQRILKYHKIQK